MAWNEPGNSGDKDKNRDPWSKRPGNKQGPPNLDEIFKNAQKKLTAIFGGGRGGNGAGSSSNRGMAGNGIFAIAILILVAWLVIDSTYIVDQAQRGVVTRFGRYVDTIGPGITWRLPRPIENVEKIDVSQVQRLPMQAQLLTKDLNLIRISLVVQYKVNENPRFSDDYLTKANKAACPVKEVTKDTKDKKEESATVPTVEKEAVLDPDLPLRNYLTDHVFAVKEPKISLQESTESALREVVGGATMDQIVSEGDGRNQLVNDIKQQIQITLDKYRTGYSITKVNLESVQPPDDVQGAFQDAIRAEEDEVTLKNQASAYVSDILPKAEGDAGKIKLEAEGYRLQVERKAEGEAQRFLQNLSEYQKAPEVTRKRMYLETMEQLLAASTKVVVKVQHGNNVMYLPLDKIINSKSAGSVTGAATVVPPRSDAKDNAESSSMPAPESRGRSADGRSR